MSEPIRLAISTCPNDTFAFHAILKDRIDLRGLNFEIRLLDISELNDGLLSGEFDVAKCSFHAALKIANEYVVLPSGSALGFGNGPLLLAGCKDAVPASKEQLTLCPGPNTTATLLFRLFHNCTRVEHQVFSEIMPALESGNADFGVCIHEGRFTYQNSGLYLVEDLGKRWEQETQCPLPLGGIVARKNLPPDQIAVVQSLIHESIRYAMANREETIPTMREYAQEFDDAVLFKHVDLYVNQWTQDLGEVGAQTIRRFNELAIERLGMDSAYLLQIFGNC